MDNEVAFLTLVKRYLTRLSGHVIIEAVSSTHEALQRVQSQPYDVIVSDYHMPEFTGLALLQTLRTKGNMIPFIFLTGEDPKDVAAKAGSLGAVHCLPKTPNFKVRAGELLNLISETVK
ncbi:MAG: response regulator [Candidatus Hodarchaeota archaeon]